MIDLLLALWPLFAMIVAGYWLRLREFPSEAFWPGAERLQSSKKQGLFVLDGQGATLSQLPGTFASIDHRVGPRGLLVAALDVDRQQAMLVNLANQRWGEPLYLPRPDYKIDGLCLYRDDAANLYLFLIGEDGLGEQWLVGAGNQLNAEAQRVRGLPLPPALRRHAVLAGLVLLFLGVGLRRVLFDHQHRQPLGLQLADEIEDPRHDHRRRPPSGCGTSARSARAEVPGRGGRRGRSSPRWRPSR